MPRWPVLTLWIMPPSVPGTACLQQIACRNHEGDETIP